MLYCSGASFVLGLSGIHCVPAARRQFSRHVKYLISIQQRRARVHKLYLCPSCLSLIAPGPANRNLTGFHISKKCLLFAQGLCKIYFHSVFLEEGEHDNIFVFLLLRGNIYFGTNYKSLESKVPRERSRYLTKTNTAVTFDFVFL